ncbi:MAG TPA: 1,6-anhydro-N-acetylmuramyl-L-alanine amidase AmpD [Gammaproteobacteria bacterium]|nr:1,6-anhydro-N-acetylmuramyl-L-alanine amidase AmpD [Gammaproteobacteria bacterium]
MKAGATAIEDGWLVGARRMASPHGDERPSGTVISLVVIHGISLPPGEFGGDFVESFFGGCLDVAAHPYFASIRELRVSPHLYVRRDGAMRQFVAFERRAWHAGISCWRGRAACNDFSIGIELEGTDEIPYSDAQYTALERVLPVLGRAWPAIGAEGIVGHADIAPGRKSDPGVAFDWPRLAAGLARAGYNFRRSRHEACSP